MALRNQPYLPLYVDDFLSDEKLIECCASTVGVYIKLMCLMHKSENYGIVLLKQKNKQTSEQIKNFAIQIAKNFAFDIDTTFDGLNELINEQVIYLDGDKLIQKRMVKDAEISEKRSNAGGKGGKSTQSTIKKFAKAKKEANTVIVNEDVIEFSFDKELSSKIMSFFGFTESANYDKMRDILSFQKCLHINNKLEIFKIQFEAYEKLKTANPLYKHSFKNFIGEQSELYLDGAWNEENWLQKLKDEKNAKRQSENTGSRAASTPQTGRKLGKL